MSWEQTYEQWTNHQNLESGLKQQLQHLEGQTKELEDAFYAPLEF